MRDENGRLLHVRVTVGRLLFADWDERWLSECEALHRAIQAERGGPTIADVPQPAALSVSEIEELGDVFDSINRTVDDGDDNLLELEWERLNDFNLRTLRAPPSRPPKTRKDEGFEAAAGVAS